MKKTSLANQLTKFEAAFVAIKDTFDCWKWLIFERMLLKFTATGPKYARGRLYKHAPQLTLI